MVSAVVSTEPTWHPVPPTQAYGSLGRHHRPPDAAASVGGGTEDQVALEGLQALW